MDRDSLNSNAGLLSSKDALRLFSCKRLCTFGPYAASTSGSGSRSQHNSLLLDLLNLLNLLGLLDLDSLLGLLGAGVPSYVTGTSERLLCFNVESGFLECGAGTGCGLAGFGLVV